MRGQGGVFYLLKLIIILAIAGSGFFYGQKIEASPNILISEICAGLNKSSNEFIELYNPTEAPITINSENFKLRLVASNNKITNKTINWINNVIPAKGYFLLGAGELPVLADATYSAQLTETSGIIIIDGNDNIIESINWGDLSSVNVKIKTNESLEKNLETKIFILQTSPNSQNSTSENIIPLNPPLSGGTENPSNPLSGDEQDNTASSTAQKINFGDAVINELVWLQNYQLLFLG